MFTGSCLTSLARENHFVWTACRVHFIFLISALNSGANKTVVTTAVLTLGVNLPSNGAVFVRIRSKYRCVFLGGSVAQSQPFDLLVFLFWSWPQKVNLLVPGPLGN